MRRFRDSFVAPFAGLVVFGLGWEGFVRWRGVKPFILLPPSKIARELWRHLGTYLDHAAVTGAHALAGLLIAVAVGIGIGAVLVTSRFAELAVAPVLVLIGVAPWVAYFTSVVAWLGPDWPPVVFLVAFVCFPAFVFAAVTGLRSADPAAVELLRTIDAGRVEMFWRLRLPSALPSLLATARYVLGLALAAAYFGEGANLSTRGLGSIGRRAANAGNPTAAPTLWASVAATALLGVVGLGVIAALERTLLHWHASQRLLSPGTATTRRPRP